MRIALAVGLVVLLICGTATGKASPATIIAEWGASAIAVGVYSCFAAGIYSQVQELSASAQHASLAEVSLPRATLLVAAGTALVASPFLAASAVSAVGGLLGQTGGPAFAVSLASAYAAAALVFDHEWRLGSPASVEWLPDWLPVWVVRLAVATSVAATVGFNVGAAIR